MNKKIIVIILIIIIIGGIVLIGHKSPLEKEEEKLCLEFQRISVRSNFSSLWKTYNISDVVMCRKYGVELKDPTDSFKRYQEEEERDKKIMKQVFNQMNQ